MGKKAAKTNREAKEPQQHAKKEPKEHGQQTETVILDQAEDNQLSDHAKSSDPESLVNNEVDHEKNDIVEVDVPMVTEPAKVDASQDDKLEIINGDLIEASETVLADPILNESSMAADSSYKEEGDEAGSAAIPTQELKENFEESLEDDGSSSDDCEVAQDLTLKQELLTETSLQESSSNSLLEPNVDQIDSGSAKQSLSLTDVKNNAENSLPDSMDFKNDEHVENDTSSESSFSEGNILDAALSQDLSIAQESIPNDSGDETFQITRMSSDEEKVSEDEIAPIREVESNLVISVEKSDEAILVEEDETTGTDKVEVQMEPTKYTALLEETLNEQPAKKTISQPPTLSVRNLSAKSLVNNQRRTLRQFGGSYVYFEVEATMENAEQNLGRYKIIREWLTTENTYMTSITGLLEVFVYGLRDKTVYSGSIVNDPGVTMLLNNIEQIHSLNSNFLAELESRVNHWRKLNMYNKMRRSAKTQVESGNGKIEVGTIVDILGHFSPHFKLYARYCSNRSKASLVMMDYMKKSSKYEKFVHACEANPKFQGQSLESLLIMPIQRVPRYILMMKELIKRTPAHFEDFEKLGEVERILSRVASEINESVRRSAQRDEVLKLAHQMPANTNIVQPGRLLLKDGRLLKMNRKKGVLQELHWHLFNDILTYSHFNAITGMFFKTRVIDLTSLTIDTNFENIPSNIKPENSFVMRFIRKSFIVSTTSPFEQSVWMQEINRAVSTAKRRSESGSMEDDGEKTVCSICNCTFSLINRRHSCKNCARTVCHTCSKERCIVSKINEKKPVRVCDICHFEMKNSKEEMRSDNSVYETKSSRSAEIPSTSEVETSSIEQVPTHSLMIRTHSSAQGDGFSIDLSSPQVPVSPISFSPSSQVSRESLARDILNISTTCLKDLQTSLESIVRPVAEKLMAKNNTAKRAKSKGKGVLAVAAACDTLEQIMELKDNFLESIQQQIAHGKVDPDALMIGELITVESSLISLIGKYGMIVENAWKCVKQHEKVYENDPKLQDKEAQLVMFLPLQFFGKNIFFLEKLIKVTPKEHPDAQYVEKAIKIVRGEDQKMRRSLRAQTNTLMQTEIKKRIHGDFTLNPESDTLVQEFSVFLHNIDDHTVKQRLLIVFTHRILVASDKRALGGSNFKFWIDIKDIKEHRPSKKSSYIAVLRLKDSKKLEIRLQSDAERDDFVRVIKRLVYNMKEAKD